MMVPADPISLLLARHAANANAAADPATRDATPVVHSVAPPVRMIGPARPRPAQPQPMRGPLGALFSAGESVHNGIVARDQAGLKPQDILLALSVAFPELVASRGVANAAVPLSEDAAARQFYSSLPAMVQNAQGETAAYQARAVRSLFDALPR